MVHINYYGYLNYILFYLYLDKMPTSAELYYMHGHNYLLDSLKH